MLKARFALIISTALFALAINFAPAAGMNSFSNCPDGVQWAGSHCSSPDGQPIWAG